MSVDARARQNNPKWQRNLKRRLAKPALGNGRVQRACKMAFIAFDGPITTSDAIAWAYPRHDRRPNHLNVAVRRALVGIGAIQVGHARTRGRPWLWAQHDAT